MNAIECCGLRKVYSRIKGKKLTALSGLDLSIQTGEVFGFLGPNGAGKSTTIKALMGLITPSSGSAALFGVSASDSNSRQNVGYLPENPAFYDFLTAREYLTVVGRFFGMSKSAIDRESQRVLGLLDLDDAAQRPIRGYSKGMVQRLGLAQALLHDPALYILDEPMSGLDPIGRALVKQIMIDLKSKGKTVFFSTHVTADVEAVCDRVGVIVGGHLRAMKSVEEIMGQGVEGYRVQMSECAPKDFEGFQMQDKGKGVWELYVPCPEFNHFLAAVRDSGASVYLIEPQRKNLEAFFLDIVKKGNQ